jgi:hypothetical protein
MAVTGRPKVEKPYNHVVTVKFREDEYQIMVDYAERHNLTVSQMLRMGIEIQLASDENNPKVQRG